MRRVLSKLLTEEAIKNEKFLVLSGDHGYAFFDEIRKVKPDQFVNVGMIEQAMVGIASGLTDLGFSTIVYGLSSFIPLRVLEQIKLDVCYKNLPIRFIGDAAGLVYSTLGSSHQCGEDIACLRSLPNISIFSPGDPEELRICFTEMMKSDGASYLRVGKSDNPVVNYSPLSSAIPYITHKGNRNICFVSTGTMLGIAHDLSKQFNASHVSIMKIRPLEESLIFLLRGFDFLCFFEEHGRTGGLTSAVCELFIDNQVPLPRIEHFCLQQKFAKNCGSHQFALSEHGISDRQLRENLSEILNNY